MSKKRYSGIGGQAVMEGIMMRNKEKYSVAVRKSDGEIEVMTGTYEPPIPEKITSLPFIRGTFVMINSLVLGMKTLGWSAEFFEEDEEEGTKSLVAYTSMEGFAPFQKALDEAKITVTNASLQRIPNNMKELPTADGVQVLKMIDAFEEDDDVQAVYHNLEVTDEMEAAME